MLLHNPPKGTGFFTSKFLLNEKLFVSLAMPKILSLAVKYQKEKKNIAMHRNNAFGKKSRIRTCKHVYVRLLTFFRFSFSFLVFRSLNRIFAGIILASDD